MKISVLGCGRWGSFIAWYLDKIGHKVALWGRSSSKNLAQLQNTRKNQYLSISDTLELTSDLTYAVERADAIVISISAQQLGELLGNLAALPVDGKPLILCMKGIEAASGKRLSEKVSDILSDRVQTAVWVGPGHVQSFVAGIPNCMVIDSLVPSLKEYLVSEFSSELIRFYYGHDMLGNEIGAASKNVIGIAAGMLDGLSLSSMKGALMARGTREISRLIKAMGGSELTAYGLSHLGDYEATLFSQHSQNRRYGEALVKHEDYGYLAEGVDTAKAMMVLKERYDVDLPICTAIYEATTTDVEPRELLMKLFMRSIKSEF